jgi:hypothetical protein
LPLGDLYDEVTTVHCVTGFHVYCAVGEPANCAVYVI